MYVCLCNNITTKKINRAIESGCSDSNKIHSFYKCKPKCGKCINFMKEMINEKIPNKKNKITTVQAV